MLRDDFSAVARDLALRARNMDESVSTSDILQACRNAWTACGLQALLGEPPRLTPAIFAYSMLYPYSDNYLDNRAISPLAKLRFSARFRLRLAGDLEPGEGLENTIWKLVSLIEGQWPREQYPDVYAGLLAIHAAQERSLAQQRAGFHSYTDILRLSFAKGGASVLADAYLAKGSLSSVEARFAFGWGVLLQLGDDLQDLASDGERGFHTLFSAAVAEGTLDDVTTQTLNFASAVMESMPPLAKEMELSWGTAPKKFNLFADYRGRRIQRILQRFLLASTRALLTAALRIPEEPQGPRGALAQPGYRSHGRIALLLLEPAVEWINQNLSNLKLPGALVPRIK